MTLETSGIYWSKKIHQSEINCCTRTVISMFSSHKSKNCNWGYNTAPVFFSIFIVGHFFTHQLSHCSFTYMRAGPASWASLNSLHPCVPCTTAFLPNCTLITRLLGVCLTCMACRLWKIYGHYPETKGQIPSHSGPKLLDALKKMLIHSTNA